MVSTRTYSFSCYEAGNSSLPAVLFLHGFMGRGSDWQRIVEQLQETFYCIAPDLPGHGDTIAHEGSEGFAMPTVAEGVRHMLAQRGITRCAVVGYSMGGRLALHLAATYPHLVRAAVLESASPGLRTDEERQARQQHDERLAVRLETTPFGEFLEQWYNQPLFVPLRHHPSFGRVVEQRRNNTPTGLATSLRRMGTGVQPPLWDALSHIEQPLLLLAGEHDEKFVRIGNEMATACPHAQLRIVERAGHTIHVENEQSYTEHVRLFLEQVRPLFRADNSGEVA